MDNTPFIQFIHVYKAFGSKVIYEDLNLEVRRGETITIIGGSGSGKSVMLKLLIGLLPADQGEILVDGQSVIGKTEEELLPIRRRISMLFQGAALFDSLTVAENVAYPLHEQTDWPEDKIQARVTEVLDKVGLPGVETMMPADLSGGMRKRVGLARAIAVGPECILWDEPTTGLDPVNIRRISQLIVKMRDTLGCTNIVVTHEMLSAFMVSNRIAMVANKRIAVADEVEAMRQCKIPFVHDFIHAMDLETLNSTAGLQDEQKFEP
jgi:phospholipid/cholesterol/gamma-HCH transport system ATP-binding protein